MLFVVSRRTMKSAINKTRTCKRQVCLKPKLTGNRLTKLLMFLKCVVWLLVHSVGFEMRSEVRSELRCDAMTAAYVTHRLLEGIAALASDLAMTPPVSMKAAPGTCATCAWLCDSHTASNFIPAGILNSHHVELVGQRRR